MPGIAKTKLLAASILIICGATNALAGGRALFPEDSPRVVYGEKRQEFGSGWYLRGDAGWSRDSLPSLSADGTLTTGTEARNIGSLSIGFGYKINSWFRLDGTAEWRSSHNSSRTSAAFACPLEVRGLTNQVTGLNVGIYAIQNQCRAEERASLRRGVFLTNAYFDLGTWAGVTPFVGVGVGMAYGQTTGNYDWIDTANNGPYSATLTAPGGFPIIWMDEFGNPAPAHQFGVQNRRRVLNQTKFNLAWALMAGFAYSVSKHAKIEFGYRYLNMGKWGSSNKANTAQEFRIGFRYQVD